MRDVCINFRIDHSINSDVYSMCLREIAPLSSKYLRSVRLCALVEMTSKYFFKCCRKVHQDGLVSIDLRKYHKANSNNLHKDLYKGL